MKVKTGLNLFVMLAVFAFGPRENRDFFFRTPPDQLYGELEIYRDTTGDFCIARNVSPESVELLDNVPVRVRSMDLRNSSFYTSEVERHVYTETMAIIERGSTTKATVSNIRIGKSQPRQPRGLRIITEAEEFDELIWPIAIVSLAVILTYLINDFSWECGYPIRDILGSNERPSQ